MMTTADESVPNQLNETDLFQRLEAYPWASDEDFQSGLRAIVEASSDQDAEVLTAQARCFYYSRKYNVSIDALAYQSWRAIQASQPNIASEKAGDDSLPTTSEENAKSALQPGKPPYPLSFSRLVELITEGKEIPGIQEIPDTVLEGQASQPTASQRRKPWEK